MKVISEQDIRIATLSGAVVLFHAGKPREVADEIGLLALQMGAKEVKGKAEVEVVADAPPEPDVDELVGIMQDLIKDGDPQNFKADGTPKAAVVNKAAGRTVSTDDRLAAWEAALNS
tara:strand:- start:268 stop:618 length:351 start_codon:yes stop_codon:yes gene_type:complete